MATPQSIRRLARAAATSRIMLGLLGFALVDLAHAIAILGVAALGVGAGMTAAQIPRDMGDFVAFAAQPLAAVAIALVLLALVAKGAILWRLVAADLPASTQPYEGWVPWLAGVGAVLAWWLASALPFGTTLLVARRGPEALGLHSMALQLAASLGTGLRPLLLAAAAIGAHTIHARLAEQAEAREAAQA